MDIFNYSKATGELLSQSSARENPLEDGEFLIPANATTIMPSASDINEIAIFDGNEWSLVPDFRGVKYWIENNNGIKINKLNVSVPVYATIIEPPTLDSILDNGVWRDKTPAELDAEKDAQVEAELSNPAIRILAEVFASKFVPPLNAADIITEAKQRRRDEL